MLKFFIDICFMKGKKDMEEKYVEFFKNRMENLKKDKEQLENELENIKDKETYIYIEAQGDLEKIENENKKVEEEKVELEGWFKQKNNAEEENGKIEAEIKKIQENKKELDKRKKQCEEAIQYEMNGKIEKNYIVEEYEKDLEKIEEEIENIEKVVKEKNNRIKENKEIYEKLKKQIDNYGKTHNIINGKDEGEKNTQELEEVKESKIEEKEQEEISHVNLDDNKKTNNEVDNEKTEDDSLIEQLKRRMSSIVDVYNKTNKLPPVEIMDRMLENVGKLGYDKFTNELEILTPVFDKLYNNEKATTEPTDENKEVEKVPNTMTTNPEEIIGEEKIGLEAEDVKNMILYKSQDKEENDFLTKSISDLQIENHKDYNSMFYKMEEHVNKLYDKYSEYIKTIYNNNNIFSKEEIEKLGQCKDEDDLKETKIKMIADKFVINSSEFEKTEQQKEVFHELSTDAKSLLGRRILREYAKNYDMDKINRNKESVFSKIKTYVSDKANSIKTFFTNMFKRDKVKKLAANTDYDRSEEYNPYNHTNTKKQMEELSSQIDNIIAEYKNKKVPARETIDEILKNVGKLGYENFADKIEELNPIFESVYKEEKNKEKAPKGMEEKIKKIKEEKQKQEQVDKFGNRTTKTEQEEEMDKKEKINTAEAVKARQEANEKEYGE